MEGWQDTGLTPVIVRPLPDDDRIMFAEYLVDFYCLGIKNAFTKVDYSRESIRTGAASILQRRHAGAVLRQTRTRVGLWRHRIAEKTGL